MQEVGYAGRGGRNSDIGETVATERFPNSMDGFWFSVSPEVVLNPFDFVTVSHILGTKTIGMHVIAKLGMTELSTPPYSMIDESTKMNIVRLNKGELVMVHPAFRHPVRVILPKSPFKD